MRAACIVPVEGLDLIEDFTYYLALAHLVLADPDVATFYRERAEGAFLILDNSAHELGEALSVERLIEAASLTNPDVLVVPDKIWDAEASLRLVENFKETATSLKSTYPGLQFMGVPHGHDSEQLDGSLGVLLGTEYLDIIGLPKTYPRLELSRGAIAKQVGASGKKVHFLGIWQDPIREVLDGKAVDSVMGVDSSYAVRLGMAGRTLLEAFPTPRPLDFLIPREDLNLSWIKRQVAAYRYLVESPVSSEAEIKQAYKNGEF
jgi:hypothetical protein